MSNAIKRKKSGGRSRGTPNRITKMQRNFIQMILDNQTDRLEAELSALRGNDYVKSVLALLEFTIPKLSRTEIKDVTPNEPKTYFRLPDGTRIEI